VKIGISACLLGEKVRYDGGHKLDRYLVDILGQYVEWVPVCPEYECGLGVPREAMRLVGTPENPRLVTIRSGIDHTDVMMHWADTKIHDLSGQRLCGYVFKSRSPSSGMQGVKVYSGKGAVTKKGVGIWARRFIDAFPLIPLEDEGRLNDAVLRENFIERIFVVDRWHTLCEKNLTRHGLVDFHTDHKLLFMAHGPTLPRALGAMVASAEKMPLTKLFENYYTAMMQGLTKHATVKKHVNVLQHIMGYFKKQLSSDEKKELLEVIGSYHNGLIPLVVPITLLSHYVRIYDIAYLKRQWYLHPHPPELKLRNHV